MSRITEGSMDMEQNHYKFNRMTKGFDEQVDPMIGDIRVRFYY